MDEAATKLELVYTPKISSVLIADVEVSFMCSGLETILLIKMLSMSAFHNFLA